MRRGFRATRFFPTARGRSLTGTISITCSYPRFAEPANRAPRPRGSAAKCHEETNREIRYVKKRFEHLGLRFHHSPSSPVAPRPESRRGAVWLLFLPIAQRIGTRHAARRFCMTCV